ncbi:GxxExxY protein [Flavobacterium sp.]|uniref:GxxExxY protein n=1 Tax=Flavobacterium sp. TaxID=239 RepID=UPI0024891977|nr:GxxExxY protein [Flavobacterium sp.]MDI1316642.1 GxxExxY protein [Flavobacterium sp.]
MLLELKWRGFEVESKKHVNVFYKNENTGEYVPDLIVNNSVILELKCVEYMTNADENQILNYLKATHCEVGLVLNFGKDPRFIRKIFTNNLKKHYKN